ncbi:MAG: type II toxin-antitoxin system VapC family toxin [Cellvibrio sp.]|nr:type II toxin-antitoxin system VapC family toxin [Cellvibrio sp.]
MEYLLDTNICIYLAKNNPPQIRKKLASLQGQQIIISIITMGELRFGAAKSQHREKATNLIDQLTRSMRIEDLTPEVAEHYGDIRAALEKNGKIIGHNDLWLAAHARSQNWILVTNNEREFLRVDGLKVENWI